MNSDKNSIPDLKIENIGSKKKPHRVIKGFISLPCWNGYYLYDDSYKLIKEKVVTNGRISLWVDGRINPDNSLHFSQEQINAYWYLVAHQGNVQQAMLQNLKQEFPRLLREEYASWDQDDPEFPRLSDFQDLSAFQPYIGPESISIGEDVKDAVSYITWRFRCRWDPEHGLDIITHKERVIEMAPEADPFKIYADNGTLEQEEAAAAASKLITPRAPKKKSWWQFW